MKTKKRITVSMTEETARVVYTLVELALDSPADRLPNGVKLTKSAKNKLVELSDELAFQITTGGA